MGRRSAEVKRLRRLANAQQVANPQPQVIEPEVAPSINVAPEPANLELNCAREQLERANGKLSTALSDDDTEAVNVERLTRAVASLREQVRILEGRPLPGARRPGPERVRRDSPAAPLD